MDVVDVRLKVFMIVRFHIHYIHPVGFNPPSSRRKLPIALANEPLKKAFNAFPLFGDDDRQDGMWLSYHCSPTLGETCLCRK